MILVERRPALGTSAQVTGELGYLVTADTVARSLPLQQLPEVIFGQADNCQDVPQRSLGHVPAGMDRYRNGSTVRVFHDMVAATDPNHREPGSFQGLDDFSARQGRHLTHDGSLRG